MAREEEGGKTPMVTTRWWRLEPKWANLLTCFSVASALILTAKRVDSSYLKTFRSCRFDAKTLRLWPTDKFSPECGKDYNNKSEVSTFVFPYIFKLRKKGPRRYLLSPVVRFSSVYTHNKYEARYADLGLKEWPRTSSDVGAVRNHPPRCCSQRDQVTSRPSGRF